MTSLSKIVSAKYFTFLTDVFFDCMSEGDQAFFWEKVLPPKDQFEALMSGKATYDQKLTAFESEYDLNRGTFGSIVINRFFCMHFELFI